jgi:hypothetical protein
MEVPATQPTMTIVDPVFAFDAKGNAKGDNMIPPPSATPAGATPEAGAVTPAEVPATPAVTPVVAEANPLDDVIGSLTGAPAATTPWDDSAKALFKNKFGSEDPDAYLAQNQARDEQFNLIKTERDQAINYKTAVESMSPAMRKAFELHMEGKDAVAFLKSMPDAVIQNKPAAELSDEYICTVYAPGKTDSAFATLKNPDASEEAIQAAKDVIQHYRSIGEDRHEAARSKEDQEAQAAQAQRTANYETFQKGTSVAIANLKSSPMKAFVDQGQIDEYSKPGAFLSKFVENDGVTPKPNAFVTIAKGERFDEAVIRASESGYKRGREEGILEATSKQPSTPQVRRDTAPVINQATERSADTKTLDTIEQGIR